MSGHSSCQVTWSPSSPRATDAPKKHTGEHPGTGRGAWWGRGAEPGAPAAVGDPEGPVLEPLSSRSGPLCPRGIQST